MKFGTIVLSAARDAILAHSVRLPDLSLSKGRRLSEADLDALGASGVRNITVAQLEARDIGEDEAAARAATGLAGSGLATTPARTGRVNLKADVHGLVRVNPVVIDALNAIDEGIAIATLPAYDVVHPGDVVATVKVIRFAVGKETVRAWETAANAIDVAPFVPQRAALIQTRLRGTKESVLAKTRDVTARRLSAFGSMLTEDLRVAHTVEAVAAALVARLAAGDDLLLVCGASSAIDRNDVVPAAVVAAEGRVDHFGMPADPGNLLFVGHIGTVPVVGLPGCARSPRVNGTDLVLRRLLAGLPVGPGEIMAMGVGGLLRDVAERPMPRAAVG